MVALWLSPPFVPMLTYSRRPGHRDHRQRRQPTLEPQERQTVDVIYPAPSWSIAKVQQHDWTNLTPLPSPDPSVRS